MAKGHRSQIKRERNAQKDTDVYKRQRIDRSEKVRVHFHQAKWDEPIIYELSTPGERGILVGAPDEEIAGQTKGVDALPEGMKRNTKLNLDVYKRQPLNWSEAVKPKRFRAGLYPCPGNFRQAAAWPGARLKVKKGGWESC